MPKSLLVFCTCPDRGTALELANHLVDAGVAACVSITADLTSVYRWQGRLEQSEESLLLIKTSEERYQDLEDAIRTRHPYELPEVIAVPIEKGLANYLQWVQQCTNAPE